MTNKSHPVSVRLPLEVKEAAEAAAKADVRSLSSFIEKVLTDYLTSKGHLPSGKQ
jgi:predicted HicB family RNase H-like nuclease